MLYFKKNKAPLELLLQNKKDYRCSKIISSSIKIYDFLNNKLFYKTI